MHDEIEKADFVLCIGSPLYIKRFDGKEEKGKGLGAKWEGAIIYQSFYEVQGGDAKFIGVAFSREDAEKCIPLVLRGPTRYVLEDERAYEDLYRRLTNQPRIVAPPIGEMRVLNKEGASDPAGKELTGKASGPQPRETREAQAVFQTAMEGKIRGLPAKVALLEQDEQFFVILSLITRANEPVAMDALGAIAADRPKGLNLEKLATGILKHLVLNSDVATSATMMRSWPAEVIAKADPSVRVPFFEEVIATMHADQYEDVNRITPAVVEVHMAIPPQLHAEYMLALLGQGDSGAYTGAPAALKALEKIPEELAKAGLAVLTPELLVWKPGSQAYKTFLHAHRSLWPSEKAKLFEDYLTLSESKFLARYSPF
jgi:hypothetical protein